MPSHNISIPPLHALHALPTENEVCFGQTARTRAAAGMSRVARRAVYVHHLSRARTLPAKSEFKTCPQIQKALVQTGTTVLKWLEWVRNV